MTHGQAKAVKAMHSPAARRKAEATRRRNLNKKKRIAAAARRRQKWFGNNTKIVEAARVREKARKKLKADPMQRIANRAAALGKSINLSQKLKADAMRLPVVELREPPFPASIITAIEFGFRCSERGMNLTETIDKAFGLVLDKVQQKA
jgi:hypothetical protein